MLFLFFFCFFALLRGVRNSRIIGIQRSFIFCLFSFFLCILCLLFLVLQFSEKSLYPLASQSFTHILNSLLVKNLAFSVAQKLITIESALEKLQFLTVLFQYRFHISLKIIIYRSHIQFFFSTCIQCKQLIIFQKRSVILSK